MLPFRISHAMKMPKPGYVRALCIDPPGDRSGFVLVVHAARILIREPGHRAADFEIGDGPPKNDPARTVNH